MRYSYFQKLYQWDSFNVFLPKFTAKDPFEIFHYFCSVLCKHTNTASTQANDTVFHFSERVTSEYILSDKVLTTVSALRTTKNISVNGFVYMYTLQCYFSEEIPEEIPLFFFFFLHVSWGTGNMEVCDNWPYWKIFWSTSVRLMFLDGKENTTENL